MNYRASIVSQMALREVIFVQRWSRNLVINRKKNAWSQEDLAKKLGVDIKTLRSWEKGEHTPQPNCRQKICSLFGTSIEDFGFLDPLVEKNERKKEQESNGEHMWYKKISFLIEPVLFVVIAVALEAMRRGLPDR
jgi:DNA-binding XRE family transcriptional regulator